MLITDFLTKTKIQFPNVPTGKAETITELYEDCIKPVLPNNKETIIKWHNLLVKYANDPNAILISRLYENRKENGVWDTRRGMLTTMQDNFSYAFATNFFPRIIYTMAYYDYVPEYEDFKKMFTDRKFSLFSFMGKTSVEKKYAAFQTEPYKPQFYTQNWYLAHIVAVNDEPFYQYESYNINNILPPGNLRDWNTTSDGYYLRFLNYTLNNDEKTIARAHFLRFIDPINYFLVPNSKHISVNKIGENPNLIAFMKKRQLEIYHDLYLDFLTNALSDSSSISFKTTAEIGTTHISNLFYFSNSTINTKIPNNTNPNNNFDEMVDSDNISNDEILIELSAYMQGSIDKGFSEKELNYCNEYISAVCFNHSNKWLGKPNESDMEKMWSIIYKPKNDFSNISNWKQLCKHYDVSISEVTKGKNQGCYGIRIKGMKKKPNETIICKILDYIFN